MALSVNSCSVYVYGCCSIYILHLRAAGFECMSKTQRQFILYNDVVTVTAITILPMPKLSLSKLKKKNKRSIQEPSLSTSHAHFSSTWRMSGNSAVLNNNKKSTTCGKKVESAWRCRGAEGLCFLPGLVEH